MYEILGFWLLRIAKWFLKLCLLLSIATFGFQVFRFLYAGNWLSLSAIDGLVFVNSSWATSPSWWYGFHSLLAKTPLSLSFLIVGLLIFIYVAFFGFDVMNWGPTKKDEND